MMALLRDGPMLRTRLMTDVRTSYKVYRKRFIFLMNKGLIEECDDMDKSIQLTELGWKFIRNYEALTLK